MNSLCAEWLYHALLIDIFTDKKIRLEWTIWQSHILFADDTMFFLHTNTKSCETLKGVLFKYETTFRQMINPSKSSISFFLENPTVSIACPILPRDRKRMRSGKIFETAGTLWPSEKRLVHEYCYPNSTKSKQLVFAPPINKVISYEQTQNTLQIYVMSDIKFKFSRYLTVGYNI